MHLGGYCAVPVRNGNSCLFFQFRFAQNRDAPPPVARKIDSCTTTPPRRGPLSGKATHRLEKILLHHFSNVAFLPQHAPNGRPWACIGMRGLEPDCADSEQRSKACALANGLGAGLQAAVDLQSARAVGRCYSGWHSIKSRAEMLAGFWQASLFQQ